MSEPKTTVENELNAARDVLLAATRQTFPKLEQRITVKNRDVYNHPEFGKIVRVLQNWYEVIQGQVKSGDRPNHTEGDIHTRIFNTGEIILYAARDAGIPSFQQGGAAILIEHESILAKKEQDNVAKGSISQHLAEEHNAEIGLVTAMYAKLLGIENQYEQARRKAEQTGGMGHP